MSSILWTFLWLFGATATTVNLVLLRRARYWLR